MTSLKVYPSNKGYIIHTKEDNGHFRYLWQDETLNTNSWSSAKFGEKGYYKTKQEAENFLQEYLMKEQVQKRIEAAEKELEAAKLELKKLDEVTYSIGDELTMEAARVILAKVDGGVCAVLINDFDKGECWARVSPKKVNDYYHITKEELTEIIPSLDMWEKV